MIRNSHIDRVINTLDSSCFVCLCVCETTVTEKLKIARTIIYSTRRSKKDYRKGKNSSSLTKKLKQILKRK